jgi:hypothetical protein
MVVPFICILLLNNIDKFSKVVLQILSFGKHLEYFFKTSRDLPKVGTKNIDLTHKFLLDDIIEFSQYTRVILLNIVSEYINYYFLSIVLF